MTLLSASIRPAWKYIVLVLIAVVSECTSFEGKTKVDIMSSTYLDEHILVTCSVWSRSPEDLRKNNVYLHCPLLGEDKICYINCDSLMVTDRGAPLQIGVFRSCQHTWYKQDRIEYQYLLDTRHIVTMGEWHCAYKNYLSSNITIQKYKHPPITSTTRSTKASTQETSTGASTTPTGHTIRCPEQSPSASMIIAGTICAFCVSAICNILLMVLCCITRYQSRRLTKHEESKERVSLLLKNSHPPRGLNHSLCSPSSSIDTPSNKESLSTYMQDTIHSGSCNPGAVHIHPDHSYRIIEIISPGHGFPMDRSGILPQQSNGDDLPSPTDQFSPGVRLRPLDPNRQYSYGSYSTQDSSHQQVPIFVGRPFTSHQQLYRDCHDESGFGADLIYQTRNPSHLVVRSSKVDLINDCGLSDMSKRTSVDT